MNPPFEMIHSDCLEALSKLPNASFNAVITDPSYPEISRDCGRLSEASDLLNNKVEFVLRCQRGLIRAVDQRDVPSGFTKGYLAK